MYEGRCSAGCTSCSIETAFSGVPPVLLIHDTQGFHFLPRGFVRHPDRVHSVYFSPDVDGQRVAVRYDVHTSVVFLFHFLQYELFHAAVVGEQLAQVTGHDLACYEQLPVVEHRVFTSFKEVFRNEASI